MLGIGVTSFIVFPQYAYYWKRQQMGSFEKGVLDDAQKLKEKGRTRAEIPQIINSVETPTYVKKRVEKNDESMFKEVI